MKIVTASEMREIDRVTTQKFGVPSLTLMESAGSAVADFVFSHYSDARYIGVICGKGNNGGDGFVAARKLREIGKRVQVLLLADPAEFRGDAAEMFLTLKTQPVIAKSEDDLNSEAVRDIFHSDLLLDAILGTGFRPPVTGLYAAAIHALNATTAPVIAVDIPSGADADVIGEQPGSIARADAIVTFTAPRPAHVFGALTGGPTIIAPIGSPEDAITSSIQLNLITPPDIAPLLGPRPRNSNKGSFGHVLVVGGSLGKSGAAAMAGISVLRAGAGLSTVATPKSILNSVASFHPEVMTEPLEETDDGSISLRALAQVQALAGGKTVLAIGPGLSRIDETAQFVRELLRRSQTPIVLDADGLNAFDGHQDELSGKTRPVIITPHPGEMARLIGSTIPAVQRDRITVARTFAREHHVIVVLKGHRTLVANPDGEVWVNATGNPGMATGGTGDILTGMTAGLVAQNPTRIFEAVLAAVHLHGLAGDVACETQGEHSLVATDLLKGLPEAFRRTQAAAKSAVQQITE
jgi:ADP-dependent NAD(P)H-hydrate dehydratase / NAD(P)H-hydrate epimerase